MPKTDYLSDAQLEHTLRTTAFTKPTTLYFALFTADPTRAGLLTNELPIGVGGYARASVAVGDAQWSAPFTSGSYRAVLNDDTISFGTASGDLGEVTHIGVMDAATEGNMLYYGALDTPRTILNGDPIQIPAGSVQIAES